GGSLQPSTNGRPLCMMRPIVPYRGARYAVSTVNSVRNDSRPPITSLSQVEGCLIHTGSKKILDGVCAQLDLDPDSAKVRTSYEILQKYGNLSSASTGFMLAEKSFSKGPAMVVSFGVGFAASAGLLNFN
ncbi:MAG: hypothetical protein H7Y30_17290, partial [Pyrinomonadaceae bacterium]|nr:hypothetical protein [Pyrinomonadaceae bacterium]